MYLKWFDWTNAATTCFTGSHLRHAPPPPKHRLRRDPVRVWSRDITDFGMLRDLSLGWVCGAELLTTVISKNNITCQFGSFWSNVLNEVLYNITDRSGIIININ
jgi:hypothetical protein